VEGLVVREAAVRLYLLIGAFGVVALWEALAPRRVPLPEAGWRWCVNIGLTVLLSAVVATAYPVLAVGASLVAERHGFGLLRWWSLPGPVAFAGALVALDLARYGEHALMHRVPLLWRLHRVHHSDTHYDCTTALRFHPLEALATVGLHLAVIVALGAPPAAVLAFEAAAIVLSMFSHGNVRVPAGVERGLRLAIVTPDLHRVHHSAFAIEAGRNFGGVTPWWDRLFGTYQAQPARGHERMAIGLADVSPAQARSLAWLLAAPFAGLPRARRAALRADGDQ
jgi:sterol desaturase/sphingolipid hydroxylase (fatty acid hydroxylase superfamily)